MGMLDEVLGKLGGQGGQSGGLGAISNLVSSQGGLNGLVQKLNQAGLGDQVKSWIGSGGNAPVSGEQVQQALGSDQVQKLADETGTSPGHVADQLAQALPHLVDRATPEGELPQSDPLQGGQEAVKNVLG